MSDFFLIAAPYAALLAAIGGGLYRFYARPFTYSSLSSQLLEGKQLYWGSVPWHYGIGFILLAHLLAAIFPGAAVALLGDPWRRIVLEGTGMGLALFALFGMLMLIVRRVDTRALRRGMTSPIDGLLLALLVLQTATGFLIALLDRWGGLWYVYTAVPWFWSLARLHPETGTVANLPTLVLFHFEIGFAIIFLFPFSRLVHVIKMPVHYLWRPYQRVIWYRRPGGGANAAAESAERRGEI